MNKDLILKVENLEIAFKNKNEIINIIRGIDLKVKKGQIVGIVGESGSGKSVTIKSLLNLNGSNAISSANKLQLKEVNLNSLNKKTWSQIRGKRISYIPQDPMTSLNPTRKIKKQLLDTLEKNRKDLKTKKERMKLIIETLNSFGIRNVEKVINQYPHTFSGGMKQRIVVASAVMCKPDLIVADEPTTALDTVVQASVLNLFQQIKEKYDVSIIFISHDIGVIAKLCDFIYVMYAGKILEKGNIKDIFTDPRHPYTWALLSSIPENSKSKDLYAIPGTPPDMRFLSSGCPFAKRNDYAVELDFIKEPPLFHIKNEHYAATWLLHPKAPKVKMPKITTDKIKIFKGVFK